MWPITGSMASRRAQFSFDGAEDATLLAGDEDAARVWCIVAAVPIVDIGALDLAAGEALCFVDDGPQCDAMIGIARQRPGVQHELAARSTGIGGNDRDLYAELPGCAGLAFADALDLRGMDGLVIRASLALLLGAYLVGAWERGLVRRRYMVACDLAADVADQTAQPDAQEAQLPTVAVELLLAWNPALRHHRRSLGDADIGLPQPRP